MRNKNWTPEENALLIKHWPSTDTDTLLKLFPGRTMKQLAYHVRNLKERGISIPARDRAYESERWTSNEAAILIKNWKTASKEKLLQLLPGRTMQQCVNEVNRLRKKGVNVPKRDVDGSKNWSEHDMRVLIEHWETLPEDELLAKLENKHRTMAGCCAQIRKLRDAGVYIPTRSPALNRRNYDKITGVSYYKTRNAWCVRLSFEGVQHFLGTYRDKNDAIALRKLAEEIIEPVRTELRQLSKTKHGPELQEARKEVKARGYQILADLKQQLNSETEVAEDA